MEVLGTGIFIRGESGIGKSELALELLSRNHRLIADDAVDFVRVGPDILVGQCPKILVDFMEVRGLGIINVRAMFGETATRHKKKLHLILTLKQLKTELPDNIDRLQANLMTSKLLEVDIPEIILYVAPGRNLAVLVEAAARTYMLRMKGIDAYQEFSTRQQNMISHNKMNLIIVSGLSGSGKSIALQALEDFGFYCIDNLPAGLLPHFVQQLQESNPDESQFAAVGIDVRNRLFLDALPATLKELKALGITHKIIFLEANDSILIKRYKETRRRHPMTDQNTSLLEGIELERNYLTVV